MFQPWKLVKNGVPVDGLPVAIENGVYAYLAFCDSFKTEEGFAIVPRDESVRRFIHGVMSSGGGHAEMLELMGLGVMDRDDVFTWGDVAVERMELKELADDFS
jgi:hypothetical protein